MRKVIRTILILLCLSVMAYSGFQIYRELAEYREGDEAYAALEQYVDIIPPKEESMQQKEIDLPEVKLKSSAPKVIFPIVDFQTLLDMNPDTVGWLYCPDTIISYPVVQCANNDFYLTHRFDRYQHKAGCLFVDAANAYDFSDPNTIIYGHHMKNGSMFGSLSKYKKQSYFDEHPEMMFMTPTRNFRIRLFAGYVSPADGDAWRLEFTDEADRAAWIQAAIDKSTFESGIVPDPEDKIITLSTCSYEYSDARYVVLGIME